MLSKESVLERVDEVSNELAKEEWYIEFRNSIISLEESQGQEGKPLFSQYDDLWLKMICRIEMEFYIKAFRDGVVKAMERFP